MIWAWEVNKQSSYHSWYALEQGNNFPAVQQIFAVPNSKKPLPGVRSSQVWSSSVMQGITE